MATEADFLEAPSQMLENWVWREKSIKLMSGHFKSGLPIPEDLLQNLVASRVATKGGQTLRQLIFAIFDLIIHSHSQGDINTVQLSKKLYRDLLGIERIEGTDIGTMMNHLCKYLLK